MLFSGHRRRAQLVFVFPLEILYWNQSRGRDRAILVEIRKLLRLLDPNYFRFQCVIIGCVLGFLDGIKCDLCH